MMPNKREERHPFGCRTYAPILEPGYKYSPDL